MQANKNNRLWCSTTWLSPQCGALLGKRSKHTSYFPGVGGGGLVTNDWCIIMYEFKGGKTPICTSYRKVPKFSDTRKLCCNLPKIQTKRPKLRGFCQTDANRIANSEDPDQTAPLRAF